MGIASLTNNGGNLLGNKAYAESFTASHTGKLISGFVETYNAQISPATYTVEIWTAHVFGVRPGLHRLPRRRSFILGSTMNSTTQSSRRRRQ